MGWPTSLTVGCLALACAGCGGDDESPDEEPRSVAALTVVWGAADSITASGSASSVCLLAPNDGIPARGLIADPTESQEVFEFEETMLIGYLLRVTEGRRIPIGCEDGPKERCRHTIAVEKGQTAIATIHQNAQGRGCEISLTRE